MTTVVDPLGTPQPVFNRSGTAIVSLNADVSPGPALPVVAGVLIALVAVLSGGGQFVQLPSGADIGDVVEVYGNTANASWTVLSVMAPFGETIIFRKVSATNWRTIGTQ